MTPRGYPNFNFHVKNLSFFVFRTDEEINPVWASLTTFLQVKSPMHSLRVGWKKLSKTAEEEFLQPMHRKCIR